MDATPGTLLDHLADTVRTHRHRHHWSQRQLAERCAELGQPGLTRSTISKIEAGVRGDVTLTEAATLAEALGVPIADLASPPQTSRGEAP